MHSFWIDTSSTLNFSSGFTTLTVRDTSHKLLCSDQHLGRSRCMSSALCIDALTLTILLNWQSTLHRPSLLILYDYCIKHGYYWKVTTKSLSLLVCTLGSWGSATSINLAFALTCCMPKRQLIVLLQLIIRQSRVKHHCQILQQWHHNLTLAEFKPSHNQFVDGILLSNH